MYLNCYSIRKVSMHAVSFKLPDVRTVVTTFQWEMTDPVKMGMVEEIFCIRSLSRVLPRRLSVTGARSALVVCHLWQSSTTYTWRQTKCNSVSPGRNKSVDFVSFLHLVLALTNSLRAGFWSCWRFRIWFFLNFRLTGPYRSIITSFSISIFLYTRGSATFD